MTLRYLNRDPTVCAAYYMTEDMTKAMHTCVCILAAASGEDDEETPGPIRAYAHWARAAEEHWDWLFEMVTAFNREILTRKCEGWEPNLSGVERMLVYARSLKKPEFKRKGWICSPRGSTSSYDSTGWSWAECANKSSDSEMQRSAIASYTHDLSRRSTSVRQFGRHYRIHRPDFIYKDIPWFAGVVLPEVS